MGRQSLLLAVLLAGCSNTVWQAELRRPRERGGLDHEAPFLKVHTRAGHVFALASWSVDEARREVRGDGIHYDLNRAVIDRGPQRVPLDDVAILETNRPRSVVNTGAVVLGVVTGLSLGVNVFCAVNTKACYGSCPTFYADDGGALALQAEGFSGAVAPALEETDVDAMRGARAVAGRVAVEMRNEALETHVVRSVRLLAVPRVGGRRVVRAGGSFYAVRAQVAPTGCAGRDRDCAESVAAEDGLEDAPRVDPTDLGAQESIDLHFPAGEGPRGLVVTARNSLAGTFVFYQFLAWLGRDAGAFFASLDGGAPDGRRVLDAMRVGADHARIRVEARAPGGPWLPAGDYAELGPIARETQVVPLPAALPDGTVDVRLTLTRGFWKLDALALASLDAAPAPVRLEPSRVLRRGADVPDALARLRAPGVGLVTYPGDVYTLVYDVADLGDAELFLESRGYYLEWIRESWLPEQSAAAAARFLDDPRGALRALAPAFARVEPEVEAQFASTRVGERAW